MDINVSLSDTEAMALSYVALSPDEWVKNAAHERCRVAVEEIVGITVQECLARGMQIPSTRDEIVELAFAQGWVKTAVQRNEEANQLGA